MELKEIQPGLRWVATSDKPFAHEEIISLLEATGYDNNVRQNLHAALDRGIGRLLKKDSSGRPDYAEGKLDLAKFPPFSERHRFRVVLEFLPYEEEPEEETIEEEAAPEPKRGPGRPKKES